MAHVGLESWSSALETSANYSMHFSRILSRVSDEEAPAVRRSSITPTEGKLYVVAFVVMVFLGACLFSCVAPFFPTHAIERGVSQTFVGIIMGNMAIMGFIMTCVLSVTIFAIGVKFLLCAGTFVAGSCAILFGVIDFCPPGATFAVYSFIIRTIEGMGMAMYFNASYTMAAILFSDNYAFIIGLLETSTSVGTLLGPTIGGLLFAAGGYWLPFVVLGSVLILFVPVEIFVVPSSIADGVNTTSEEHNPFLVIRKMMNPATLITAYSMLVTTITWVFTETVLGVRLKEFGVTDPIIVGAIYLSSSGAYAISAPIIGRLADKFDKAWLIILLGTAFLIFGYLLIGPSPILFISFIPPGLPQLIVACLCTHSSLAAVIIPTTKEFQRQAELNGLDPNSIGTLAFITAIFQSVWFLGGFIGSVLSSSLMEYLGFGWATTIQAGVVFTSLLLQFYTIFSHGIIRLPCSKRAGYESFD